MTAEAGETGPAATEAGCTGPVTATDGASELEQAAEEWIAEHPAARHLLRTRDWVLALDRDAGEDLRIAALTHDVERRVAGGPRFDPATRGWRDPGYIAAHCERSAALVDAWLAERAAPDALRDKVTGLVLAHETGGWPAADLLQAADSLSFLEVNSHRVIDWVAEDRCTVDDARDKLDHTRERISIDRARELGEPLYGEAVAALARAYPTAI